MFQISKIVLISNGSGAIGKGLGKKIDEFEEIIRFNAAVVTPEFEKDLGSRTTHWVHSDWGYKQHEAKNLGLKRLFVVPDIRGKENIHTPNGADRVPKGFEEKLRKTARVKFGKWCTTGFTTLNWFLETNEVLYTVGWLEGDMSSPQRFFKNYFSKVVSSSDVQHDISAEKKYFETLVKSGRVIRLVN